MISVSPLVDQTERRCLCEKITADLPKWFGQDAANIQYAKDAAAYPALAAYDGETPVGLLVFKNTFFHDKPAIDIHWLGILQAYHRQGIGRALVHALHQELSPDRDLITVETLDPSVKNPEYLRSYAFYTSLGFQDAQQFNDGDTPMLRMVYHVR